MLGLGIVGLGVAGRTIIPFAKGHEHFTVVAGADPGPQAREAFAAPGRAVYGTLEEMCADVDVDVVYVASPTRLHADHAVTALRSGKHVIVEKPMAVSMASAEAMVEAAEENQRTLLVGHSQSFEAPVRAIRAVLDSGAIGRLRAVHALYYTDWMYRPRHPDELDPAQGGGVPMRQAAHHIDIIRYIGGGLLRSVRGSVGCWDSARRADGAYTAFLEFEDGTPATAVYSGYDHFPSTELTFGIGEAGQQMSGYAVARRRLAALDGGAEADLKRGTSGASRQQEMLRGGDKQPFFGFVLVSCEGGDVRVSPDGLLVYGDDAVEEISLAGQPLGRRTVLDEMLRAVRDGVPPPHDGRWGVANLEVCLALLESSRTRSEVMLSRQVALDAMPMELSLPDRLGTARSTR